ncbi:MAG TPA: DUF445 domain-containing protein [Clostridium sp.]|uniref:DUF445 domain-containing protein n=1 Tax=Clostridium sp. TaxID=1506 RepID=UPI002F948D82
MNRHKATLILILASSIYVVSYPFHNTFLGGLVYSGSCASMIGGFADWWGINKLLKRTIPKNKQKIFDGLSNMVSEELLTKEIFKKLLGKYDTSKLLIKLVKNNSEIENIKTAIRLMIEENLNKINNNELKKNISDLIISNLKIIDLHKLIIKLIEICLITEYEDKVYNFILDELILFSQTDDFKNILINFIDKSRSSYEGSSKRKKIIDGFKGSNNNLAIETQKKIEKFLSSVKNCDNKNRLILKQWTYDKLNELKNDNDFKFKVEKWKIELFKNIKIEECINMIVETAINKIVKNETLCDNIFLIIKNWMNDLDGDFVAQRKVDVFLKNIIYKLIDDEHKNVGKIVKENLSKYTDTMLVELIELNVGNDLQLIRINGSLVGGIVGIIIFIIKYSIGV